MDTESHSDIESEVERVSIWDIRSENSIPELSSPTRASEVGDSSASQCSLTKNTFPIQSAISISEATGARNQIRSGVPERQNRHPTIPSNGISNSVDRDRGCNILGGEFYQSLQSRPPSRHMKRYQETSNESFHGSTGITHRNSETEWTEQQTPIMAYHKIKGSGNDSGSAISSHTTCINSQHSILSDPQEYCAPITSLFQPPFPEIVQALHMGNQGDVAVMGLQEKSRPREESGRNENSFSRQSNLTLADIEIPDNQQYDIRGSLFPNSSPQWSRSPSGSVLQSCSGKTEPDVAHQWVSGNASSKRLSQKVLEKTENQVKRRRVLDQEQSSYSDNSYGNRMSESSEASSHLISAGECFPRTDSNVTPSRNPPQREEQQYIQDPESPGGSEATLACDKVQIEYLEIKEKSPTNEVDINEPGISVTTTTFLNGETETYIHAKGSLRIKNGVEVVTKTVVCGGKVITTTTTKLIPGLEFGDRMSHQR
jgi:hypothetical protein